MPGYGWPPRGREKPWTEIMLWATPKGPPRALQASECRELLNPTRASCLILAQRQPGKLPAEWKSTLHTAPILASTVCTLTFLSSIKNNRIVGHEARKKLYCIRIDAPLSRQPLVKGERLVRFEVSAAMSWFPFLDRLLHRVNQHRRYGLIPGE